MIKDPDEFSGDGSVVLCCAVDVLDLQLCRFFLKEKLFQFVKKGSLQVLSR